MKEREGERGREAVGGQRMTQQLIMQVRERDVERRRMAKMSQDSHQHNGTATFSTATGEKVNKRIRNK